MSKLVKTVVPLMDTLKRRCPAPDHVGLGEVERHRLRAAPVGDGVGHCPVALGVEDRRRRRVGCDLTHVDGRSVGVGAAAAEVLVGGEAAGCRAARVDRQGVTSSSRVEGSGDRLVRVHVDHTAAGAGTGAAPAAERRAAGCRWCEGHTGTAGVAGAAGAAAVDAGRAGGDSSAAGACLVHGQCEVVPTLTCHGDAGDLGIIRAAAAGELDHYLAAGIGGGGERPGDRAVGASGRSEDVEGGKYGGAIDRHIEGALSGCCPETLLEVECHRLGAPRCAVGNCIGELAVPLGLEHRLGRHCPADLRRVDGVGSGVGVAA